MVEQQRKSVRYEKLLNLILKEVVYGGHLISLGAVGIVLTSAMVLGLRLNWQLVVIAYLITFVGLLYNRYREQDTDFLTNPRRTACLKKYFHFILPIIFSSILTCVVVLIAYQKAVALIFILLLFLVCFLYTKYLKKITQKIITFKNFAFSLITSLLVVFLAVYCSYHLLSLPLFLMWSFVFLRMMVNTIFLDIKDVESDKKQKLLTLPIIWGREKTLLFLEGLTIFSVLPVIIGFLFGQLPGFSLMLLFVIPYSFYYFQNSKVKENFYLTNYILADAEFVLWFLFVLIGKVFI